MGNACKPQATNNAEQVGCTQKKKFLIIVFIIISGLVPADSLFVQNFSLENFTSVID